MLNNDTRKIIDDARNTLVGQIPVPMMQCQQITLALTYKFMSDDDQQAVELGGERHYFNGRLEKYGWDKIMSRRLDDTQRSQLYRAGLNALQQAADMPAVFREIFRDAVVPYGDHRTLALFLNIINRMEYDDSEKLGHAYEYLLKIAEAQADAGQFRTPRHIIDFIVNIVNPQKHEVIIDPACGTAGFLVSAWQHIKRQHALPGGGTTLSVPDLTQLADNLKGYDISPEMTKLATANMYLHTRSKNPRIANYDTLTSTDHWNEYADVMLANPPFMTPKGGIRPHRRFRVSAKRSEVLFVDYIAAHLNEHGRAGIIVPEGIIFQSQNAYRQLRRMLLDESLIAVISLPAGVFNPYSSVKTSILILDQMLAPKAAGIAFFKVANDGYDLGAQRRPIDRSDLPAVQAELAEYLRRLRAGEPVDDFRPATGLVVAKERIAEGEDYNLSGERYRENAPGHSKFEMVALGNVSEVRKGTAITRKELTEGPFPVIAGGQVPSAFHNQHNREGETITVSASGAYAGFVSYFDQPIFASDCSTIKPKKTDLISKFVFYALKAKQSEIYGLQVGMGQPHVYPKDVAEFQIPLPPLEVQRELVAEIEGYQRVIDGARAVVDNWRPQIAVDPAWPMVSLSDACKINPSAINPSTAYPDDSILYVDISSVENETGRFLGYNEIPSSEAPSRARREISNNDVLLSTVRPNLRAFTIIKDAPDRAIASTGFAVLRARPSMAESDFILLSIFSDCAVNQMVNMMDKGAYPSINQSDVAAVKIPLPPLPVQQAIVAEIEAERRLVAANRELAERMKGRIAAAVGRVWGGGEV